MRVLIAVALLLLMSMPVFGSINQFEMSDGVFESTPMILIQSEDLLLSSSPYPNGEIIPAVESTHVCAVQPATDVLNYIIETTEAVGKIDTLLRPEENTGYIDGRGGLTDCLKFPC